MKRAIVIATCMMALVMAGAYANAQEKTRQELAEELMTLTNAKQNIEQSFAQIKQMMVSQIQKMATPAGEAGAAKEKLAQEMNQMMDLIGKELSWDNMKDDYINLWADVYTDQELKDIIAFYKTPSGQAMVKKQPELMKRSMEVSQKVMAKIMPKIQAMAKDMEESMKPAAPPQPAAPKEEKK
jgi:hypothetical protein